MAGSFFDHTTPIISWANVSGMLIEKNNHAGPVCPLVKGKLRDSCHDRWQSASNGRDFIC